VVRQSQASQRVGAQLEVRGRVQGVGYRYFAQEAAQALGLCGWVRNLPDGAVESFVEGPRPAVEQWIAQMEKGPTMARVERLSLDWCPPRQTDTDFSIIS
jgi:acylphosphatase